MPTYWHYNGKSSQSAGNKNIISRRDAGTLRIKGNKKMFFSARLDVSAGENEQVTWVQNNRGYLAFFMHVLSGTSQVMLGSGNNAVL